MTVRELSLSTTPTPEAIANLRLGDIVYLDGLMYTAREGVYMRALEARAISRWNCPATAPPTFTAPRRQPFAKTAVLIWARSRQPHPSALPNGCPVDRQNRRKADHWQRRHVLQRLQGILRPQWRGLSFDCRLRTGALRRGVEKVEAVHWNAELGLAQAMWVIRCNRMGPFIVASDLDGNCLFERENAKIAQNFDKLYEGTRPATLKRYGETDNRGDEVI